MIESPAQARLNTWVKAATQVYRHTAAGRDACRQGFVVTHAQRRECGLEAAEVRRLLRRGEWTVPRRGVLCALPAASGTYGRRPIITATALALVRPHAVLSHECAALARGLDVYRVPKRATLTTSFRLHAHASASAVVRAAKLDDDEVGQWFGVAITTCARTVADLARTGARSGIVAADSALYNGLVSVDELHAAVEHQRRWHGVITARRVLELASPLSESALESLARLFLAEHRIPLPEQQRWIETYRGWYRVDGLWEEENVILEADGMVKYVQSADDPTDNPLTREKLRQEALERAGFRVVRVTWGDIHADPLGTVARIWAALR